MSIDSKDNSKFVQARRAEGLTPFQVKDSLIAVGFAPAEARDIVLTHWDDGR